MQGFQLNSFGAAILLSTLLMGVLGAFVILPVAFVQVVWNVFVTQFFALPLIGAWQASLLYIACGIALYLSGLVQFEVKSETLD